MKFRHLFFSLLIVSSLVSCNNDNDSGNQENNTNTITINGNSFDANFSLKHYFDGYYEIIFATTDLTASDFTGTVSFFGVFINSETDEVEPGTYTFSLDSAPDYDPSIHFFAAEAGQNIVITNGQPYFRQNNYFIDINDGTVTIEEVNSEYRVSFNMQFDNASVLGSYQGLIE